MLVEAQEGLRPKTLIPCHRIDRVTSGMTICCADSRVARLIQTAMAAKANGSSGSRISKQYLARVMGRFPSNETNEGIAAFPSANSGALARWAWIANDPKKMMADEEIDSNLSAMLVQVDAPIETVDPLNGVRKITPEGKASTSLFRLLEYDAHTDTSIIACVPVTGRSHQLRVHLQWLGHSIVNDAQYGAAASSGMQIEPSAGLQRMIDNVHEYNSHAVEYTSAEATTVGSGSSLTITEEQLKAARDVCPTCDLDTEGRGPSSAFSPAQLLQRGHAIELHAYRYSLEFPFGNKQGPTRTKESGKNETDGGQASVFRTHLSVDLPPWALHLRKRSTQSLSIPFET
jgi:23S rRNA-/tRNA-specific pseudouridylate synthase